MTDIRAHNLTDEELIRWVRSSLTSTSIERELASRFADLIDGTQREGELRDEIEQMTDTVRRLTARIDDLEEELAIQTTYEGND